MLPDIRYNFALDINLLRILLPLKAGSQCDARPCVALIRKTQIFLVKAFSDFLAIRRKDPTQRNARIGSESIMALHCVSTSVDTKVTQRNALFSITL